MQPTETGQKTRPNLDALIQEVTTSTFRDRYTAKEAKSLALELAAALATERDRADRAEAALAEAWDEGYDASATDWENGGPGNPNPYRSEATA